MIYMLVDWRLLWCTAKNPFKVEQDQGVTSQPSIFDHVWWYSTLGTCKDQTIWSYQTQTSVNINQHNHDMGLSQNRGNTSEIDGRIFFRYPPVSGGPIARICWLYPNKIALDPFFWVGEHPVKSHSFLLKPRFFTMFHPCSPFTLWLLT